MLDITNVTQPVFAITGNGDPAPSQTQRLEFDLVRFCARLQLDDDAARHLRGMLARRIDWEAVVDTARRHRVVPLVHRTLASFDAGSVPKEVIGRLRAGARSSAWRSLQLTGELVRVLDVLAENEIAAIPYKGPALAAHVYGEVSLRQFGDLDIIVRQDRVPRAVEILADRGYRVEHDITGKDFGLFNPDLRVTLEMHWTITSERHPVQIPAERLWKNLHHQSIGGRSILAPIPEDLLWMLCIHGGQHRWERLSWLCDIAEMARNQSIDWDRAVQAAVEVRAGRMVFLGLLLARDLLGAPLPPNVTRLVEGDRTVHALANQVVGWMVSPNAEGPDLGDTERYYVALRERLGDRLLIAFRQATPYLALTERDLQLLRLPRHLSWLLYIIRPFRLAWRYGLTPIKRLLEGLFKS